MQLHDLRPTTTKKKKKRVGRGGKRGTYSGRGLNGQRANAGGRFPSPEREQIKKFPKLKGIKNKLKGKKVVVFNVGDLESVFGDTKEINREMLVERGFIKKRTDVVKVLGEGDLNKDYQVKNIPVSKSAKEKIEKAGGKIIN